jgi:hypothetical protein
MSRYSFEEVSSVSHIHSSNGICCVVLGFAEPSRAEPNRAELSCCAGRIDFNSTHCVIRELDVILFPCNWLGCTAQGNACLPISVLGLGSVCKERKGMYGVVSLPLQTRNS